jgi:hypothetical protein
VSVLKNLGRVDRRWRVLIGLALGLAGIFVSNPYLGRALGIVGAIVILSGLCGT